MNFKIGNQTIIRSFRNSDLQYLYSICLKTGDSGKDATSIYKNPNLLGEFYAAPYAKFEPELTFIVEINNVPCGYILGTKDSEKFSEELEKNWFPDLRKKYPLPEKEDHSEDAKIIRLIHQGYIFKEELRKYPAHLHIDLLPIAQGKGIGRKFIFTFIETLKSLNVHSLHLEVGKKNLGAIQFYKKVGFFIIKEYDYSIAFGMDF